MISQRHKSLFFTHRFSFPCVNGLSDQFSFVGAAGRVGVFGTAVSSR